MARQLNFAYLFACRAVGSRWTRWVFVLTLLITVGGCLDSKSDSNSESASSSNTVSRGLDRSPLLKSIGETLNNLPDEVDLQLRPPEVIVAANSSRDHQPIYAVVLDYSLSEPQVKSPAFNVFNVPSRNGRFKLAKPGDKLRFFAKPDPEDPNNQFGKMMPLDKPLTVYQIVDDNCLLTREAFQRSVTPPYRVEIWRFSNDRVERMDRQLSHYVKRGEPERGWRPTPDGNARKRAVDLLNQWSRGAAPLADWKVSPLLDTLPDPIAELVDQKQLASNVYSKQDRFALQEAVWLRDIARWVTNDSNNDLQDAAALFDWTVRNIQLEESASSGVKSTPQQSDSATSADSSHESNRDLAGRSLWEILLYGKGDAEDRAWVFLNLCRHAGITAVELGIDSNTEDSNTENSNPAETAEIRSWLPAVLVEGELYLFDTRLGLPLPSADGKSVASLSQLISDEALLRQLDLSENERYPIDAEDLKHVVALIESTPVSLSARMARLESALAGAQKVILTVDPSAIAEQLRDLKQINEVRLWARPYQTLCSARSTTEAQRQEEAAYYLAFALRPTLYKARALHFQGQIEGPHGAKFYYRKSRPAEAVLRSSQRPPQEIQDSRRAKYYASHWLGIATFETGMPEASVDFLTRHTLAAKPDGSYSHSARYNLARAYEELGRTDEAIATYEADVSPQHYGNRLRARMLREKATEPKKTAGEPKATE